MLCRSRRLFFRSMHKWSFSFSAICSPRSSCPGGGERRPPSEPEKTSNAQIALGPSPCVSRIWRKKSAEMAVIISRQTSAVLQNEIENSRKAERSSFLFSICQKDHQNEKIKRQAQSGRAGERPNGRSDKARRCSFFSVFPCRQRISAATVGICVFRRKRRQNPQPSRRARRARNHASMKRTPKRRKKTLNVGDHIRQSSVVPNQKEEKGGSHRSHFFSRPMVGQFYYTISISFLQFTIDRKNKTFIVSFAQKSVALFRFSFVFSFFY